jgi:hypothetical protein
MNAFELVAGVAVLALAVWQFTRLEDFARNIHSYFSRPQPSWQERNWFFRRRSLTQRQARIFAMLVIVALLVIGLSGVLGGFGLGIPLRGIGASTG